MKSIEGRLNKLEQRFGIARSTPGVQVIMIEGDVGAAEAAYLKILDEAEFLAGSCSVDFTLIPRGLSAKEAEKFVRENGAKICGRKLPTIQKDDGSVQHRRQSGPRSPGILVVDVEDDDEAR